MKIDFYDIVTDQTVSIDSETVEIVAKAIGNELLCPTSNLRKTLDDKQVAEVKQCILNVIARGNK
jgi:hypothetical protein